jgi:Calcineurin-like phosphoesterase
MPRTAALLATALLAAPAIAQEFSFVAIGDMPYGQPSEVYPLFEALIQRINELDPALVVHVGDTKSGSTLCSDEVLGDQLGYLNSFEAPVLYTPGDNEWTDCHREAAGGFDPLERLAYIRNTYFTNPGRSFGSEKLDVTSQTDAGYPENARVMLNDVMLVTAHVVGSNNNFEPRSLGAVEEFMARDAASTEWMREAFAAASDAEAVVLAIHADMFPGGFDGSWADESGFQTFGSVLIEESAAYEKPVLLIYGDSHVFEQARPFPIEAPNLMALQVPGAEEMHAVEITVDPEAAGMFSISQIKNPALSN